MLILHIHVSYYVSKFHKKNGVLWSQETFVFIVHVPLVLIKFSNSCARAVHEFTCFDNHLGRQCDYQRHLRLFI